MTLKCANDKKKTIFETLEKSSRTQAASQPVEQIMSNDE